MTPALKQFMGQHAPFVREQIQIFFEQAQQQVSPDLPHFLHSVKTLEEFSLRGGKGIRGMLTVLGFLLAGGQGTDIYQLAAGVELFHKHLLSLDDMADRDELRNGGPTLWKFYESAFKASPDRAHHGRAMAEIDATLLGSFALELIRTTHFSPTIKLEILGVMNQTMYWETIMGWQLHYYQNQQPLNTATEAEYILGQEKVTAKYTFVGPLKIGILAAGSSSQSELIEILTAYGREVGIAFQMQDDILGLFGDSDETGKPVGNDVREGKKTLLLQRAYKKASVADQKFLEKVCGGEMDATKLARVQKIVTETGALASAQQLAEESVARGLKHLANIADHPELVQLLTDLAIYVIERKS